MKGSEPPRIKVKPQNTNTMKTRKHGNGLNHKEVVRFSNRLAARAQKEVSPYYTYGAGFDEGYASACKYFAHELRKFLRYTENNQ